MSLVNKYMLIQYGKSLQPYMLAGKKRSQKQPLCENTLLPTLEILKNQVLSAGVSQLSIKSLARETVSRQSTFMYSNGIFF